MLLIATPLQILLCDETTGRTRLVRTGDGEYFGFTWNAAGPILSHSGLDNETLQVHADYAEPARGYLSLYADAGSLKSPTGSPQGLVAPHQIECVDDTIVASNSGRNCLSLYGLDGSFQRDVRLVEKLWDVNEDGSKGNHFNSVHRKGDRLWVVSHNFERPSEVWELTWPGLETVALHVTAAAWAHNCWVGEHGPVVCDSKHGGLLAAETNETIWRASEDKAITRGLAVVGDSIFVGRSGYAPRGARKYNDGGLWVIDRKTLKTVASYVFPGIGCVNEVRALHGRDEAHVDSPFEGAWLERIAHRPLEARLGYELRKRPRAYKELLRVKRRLGLARSTS